MKIYHIGIVKEGDVDFQRKDNWEITGTLTQARKLGISNAKEYIEREGVDECSVEISEFTGEIEGTIRPGAYTYGYEKIERLRVSRSYRTMEEKDFYGPRKVGLECQKCGWSWDAAPGGEVPKVCPRCKNPNWNKPKG